MRDLRRKRTLLVSRASGRARPAGRDHVLPARDLGPRALRGLRVARPPPGPGRRQPLRPLRARPPPPHDPAGDAAAGARRRAARRPPECYSISGNGRYVAFERRWGAGPRCSCATCAAGAPCSPAGRAARRAAPAREDSGCPSLLGQRGRGGLRVGRRRPRPAGSRRPRGRLRAAAGPRPLAAEDGDARRLGGDVEVAAVAADGHVHRLAQPAGGRAALRGRPQAAARGRRAGAGRRCGGCGRRRRSRCCRRRRRRRGGRRG